MNTIKENNLQLGLGNTTILKEQCKNCDAKWYAIFDGIKDSIFLLDVNGKILFANKISRSLFDERNKSLLGRYCFEVVHKNSCFIDDCPFVKARISKKRETMLLPINDKWYDVIVDPILGNQQEFLGAVHIMVDVSEIKRTELLVEQQNKQLQELNSAKDKFFSILSHDLRSPFQDLISLTELLAEGVGDISAEEISRLGSKMHSNAKGLLKLLSNLLDWTRMQQGITRYDPEEIKLSGVVSQNFKLIIQRGEQKGINLINTVDVEQRVIADEEMLNGVLRNLLSNAIKFSNKGGKVIVSSREIENNLIEISVSDTGIGMDRELKNKLFKIDERTGRKGTNGEVSTGLGLLLCKEFVERHSGKIWVESIQNVGSTFHFTLPKAVDVDQKQRG